MAQPNRSARQGEINRKGPRCGSIRLAAKSGRNTAANTAPTIAHSSHAGKFAPAILTTGSHAASARAASASAAIGNPARVSLPITIAFPYGLRTAPAAYATAAYAVSNSALL